MCDRGHPLKLFSLASMQGNWSGFSFNRRYGDRPDMGAMSGSRGLELTARVNGAGLKVWNRRCAINSILIKDTTTVKG